MSKEYEYHEEYSKYYDSGKRARENGHVFYFTGKRCSRGHLALRHASSGNCVDCIRYVRGQIKRDISANKKRAGKENIELANIAIIKGFTTYESVSPCPKGHTERFCVNHNCVKCSSFYNEKRKENGRWRRIEKIYGLSRQEYIQKLDNQNKSCAICGLHIDYKNAHVDHCHRTNKVRGLLCSKCNQGIGLFCEDGDRLKSAIKYIEDHK
jgi:hypothetical protein